jgi:thiamine-phosphate pyrophosphorylase
MREIYRILDANFNRAREALRVCEDCGRFALNDPAITAMAKNMRSDLVEILRTFPTMEMLISRDTPGDIGTDLTSPMENRRDGIADVATAACKRLTESLRTIEEYTKVVDPARTLQVERMRYNAYTLEQRLISRLAVGWRFERVRLYALVSSPLCKGSLRETARAAIAGGADAIQLREKDVPDSVYLAYACELRELCDQTGKIFIVNDRPDVAAMCGADGVHLGQGDLPVAEARRLLRPGAIVGKSSHNIEQARAVANEGADYVSVGPMFPTRTKADAAPVAGPDLLKAAMAEIHLPIVPIGGICIDNVKALLDAGAKCVSISSAVCQADDPKAATEAIRKMMPC